MSEKTHPPTPRRLLEVRKKGEVVSSPDVVSTFTFIGVLVAVWVLGPNLFSVLEELWIHAMRGSTLTNPGQHLMLLVHHAEMVALWGMLPIIAIEGVLGVAGSFSQVGALVAWKRLVPDVNRINPAEGLKRIFAMRNLINLVKMLVKTVLLTSLLYVAIYTSLNTALRAGYASPAGVLQIGAALMLTIFGWAAVIYAVMAAVDYAHQRYEFMKQQRMSIDDLRRENKDAEGDPEILGRRKAAYREAMYAGLTERVQAASAVIHSNRVAIALQYRGPKDLPRVIARGEGPVALHIRRLAREALTPIEADAQLAERIYAEVPLDQPIPRTFYKPVVKLLRWAEGK